MAKEQHCFDVAIIGGGCAGASTALALLQNGIKNVAIIEKNDFSKPRVGETIQPPTSELLKQLGVWEPFVKDSHLPSFGVASAWGTSDLAYSDFIFRTYGKGWHLDRNVFDQMMLGLAKQSGAHFFGKTILRSASRNPTGWLLEGHKVALEAKFVVDASGRACAFAKLQGSHKIHFDDLHGIYTFWAKSEGTAENFGTSHTLVESVEQGWWYSALLPNNLLAVAFMTDTAEIKTKGLKQTKHYLKHLEFAPHTFNRVRHYALKRLPEVKSARVYELDRMTGDHWLAVGDSASAYDPLSSYGIHKALQNGLEAGASIKAALNGNHGAITAYEQYVKHEFEGFLAMRFKYYGMETRWPESAFWKSRQELVSIHPLQELKLNPGQPKPRRNWNRILPEEDMDALALTCEQPKAAAELVKDFQKTSKKGHPDWRVIHALSFLHEMKVIG